MTANEEKNDAKIPFKWRLIAWWKGYDLADVKEKMHQQELKKNAGKKENPAPTEEENQQLWNNTRVKVAQMIWGEGFCGPGGRQNVIDMSKLLALSPKMSAMVIGAGLGGPARVLAQEFGVWINGYENNELLAKEGMQISTDKGLEKKAAIIYSDLDDDPSFDRTFDRAFSKEYLYIIENKAPLIKAIYEQLKDDSLFLISDYVARDNTSLTHSHIINWASHIPNKPFLLSADAMMKCMEDAGFNIRIHEDISAPFLEMISEAWENTGAMIQQMSDDEKNAQKNMLAIQKEAELWNHTTTALRSGELQLFRYLAHKPHKAIS